MTHCGFWFWSSLLPLLILLWTEIVWLPPRWREVLQDVSCNGAGPQTPWHSVSLPSQTGQGTSAVGTLRLNSGYFAKGSFQRCWEGWGNKRERGEGFFFLSTHIFLKQVKSHTWYPQLDISWLMVTCSVSYSKKKRAWCSQHFAKLTHSFIPSFTAIKFPCCVRHCSRCWECICEQTRGNLCLEGASFKGARDNSAVRKNEAESWRLRPLGSSVCVFL